MTYVQGIQLEIRSVCYNWGGIYIQDYRFIRSVALQRALLKKTMLWPVAVGSPLEG